MNEYLSVISYLDSFQCVFWDFDGVIKESVNIKTDAYLSIFPNLSDELKLKIKNHHEKNGGISRIEKIPLYLSWQTQEFDQKDVQVYLEKFAKTVLQLVIDSDWVPGVLDLLNIKSLSQTFFIITGTPQEEIEYILRQLGLSHIFTRIIGAPTDKAKGIEQLLKEFQCDGSKAIMIGDSLTDLKAAELNHIQFLLRETEENQKFFTEYHGRKIKNFIVKDK